MWSFVSSLAETTARNASLSVSLVEASEVKSEHPVDYFIFIK